MAEIWRSPPGMVLKPVVNNGISTTVPSTGELITGFQGPINTTKLHRRWLFHLEKWLLSHAGSPKFGGKKVAFFTPKRRQGL